LITWGFFASTTLPSNDPVMVTVRPPLGADTA